MSSDFNDIPGFHGDGDSSIELHHDDPIAWTKKSTILGVVTIAVGTLLAVAGYVILMNNA